MINNDKHVYIILFILVHVVVVVIKLLARNINHLQFYESALSRDE